MSTKKVAFGTKPTHRPAPETVDLWVDNRTEDGHKADKHHGARHDLQTDHLAANFFHGRIKRLVFLFVWLDLRHRVP